VSTTSNLGMVLVPLCMFLSGCNRPKRSLGVVETQKPIRRRLRESTHPRAPLPLRARERAKDEWCHGQTRKQRVKGSAMQNLAQLVSEGKARKGSRVFSAACDLE